MADAVARAAGLAAALAALAAGKLVAMPTETVYGLAADAANPRAVAAIFAAKQRPSFNPLIAHVASMEMAAGLAEFDGQSASLAHSFWPGPLTMVLNARRGAAVADLARAGLSTLAVRQPAHEIAAELIRRFGRALVAPSANRSGRLSPTTAAHVAADLGDAIEVILDAGPSRIGLESTIVGFPDEAPTLLRPGAVTRDDIEAVLNVKLAEPAPAGDRPSAPGMLASHYAPAAMLRLNVREVEPGEGLLAFGEVPPGLRNARVIQNLSPTGDLVEAAANLFGALHELDRQAARIAVMPIPEWGLGEAINDRLRRAAAPRS